MTDAAASGSPPAGTATRTEADGDGIDREGDTTDPHIAVDAVGRSMAYATYGDPDGAPVLFLHGSPGSRLLAGLLDEAAHERGVRLVAIDRPGYGATPVWEERTPAAVAEGIDGVLEDAGISRTGVVAFSGGSRYAFAVASEGEVAVEGVDVVAGSVPPQYQSARPAVQRALTTLATRAPRVLAALVRGQAWVAARTSPGVVTGQYTTDDATTVVSERTARLVARDFREAIGAEPTGFVRETRHLAADWDPGANATEVRLWHGTHDENVPIESVRRFARKLDGAALRELDEADHLGTLLEAREPILAEYGDGS